MRTDTGMRWLRRSQIARASPDDGPSSPSRSWRLSTRRNRRTRPDARPSKTSVRMRSFSAVGTRSEASSSANRGNAAQHVLFDLVELVEHRLGLALLLGGVDQGLGIAAGDGDRGVIAGRRLLGSGRLGVGHARWPPCPLAPAAGSSLDGRLEQAAMVVRAELRGQHLARDRDGHVGGLLPDLGQGLVAGRGDVALGPLPGRFGLGLGLLDDLLGGRLGVLPRLVEDAAHLVGGAGHLPAVLGQQALALVPRPLGLLEHVLEVPLALAAARQERLPGEPAQDQPSGTTKTTRVQMRQGRLRLERIGRRLGGGRARRLGPAMRPRHARRARPLLRRPAPASRPSAPRPGSGWPASPTVRDGCESTRHGWSLGSDGTSRSAERSIAPRPARRRGPIVTGPGRPAIVAGRSAAGLYAINWMQDDQQREERHTLDQRGGDDHGRLDVPGDLRLPRHALDGALGQAADAHGRPDDHHARRRSPSGRRTARRRSAACARGRWRRGTASRPP